MPEEVIGKVSDFFARLVAAVIELTAGLKLGDKIHIKGNYTDLINGNITDLELTVESIQIDYIDIREAKAGDSVVVKVSEQVKAGDTVYKVVD